MKTIISIWKLYRLFRKKPGLLKVVEDIFKFLETSHKEQKPMVCKIALINMADGKQIGDFISLWAGLGESSPIERVRVLKGLNSQFLSILETVKESINDLDHRELVDFTLEVYNQNPKL